MNDDNIDFKIVEGNEGYFNVKGERVLSSTLFN
jgi:hypothetical protein